MAYTIRAAEVGPLRAAWGISCSSGALEAPCKHISQCGSGCISG